MITRPIILVTGATGAQGGAVAKALLQEERYTVRVLTRDKNSVKAKALEEAGAHSFEGLLCCFRSYQFLGAFRK